MPDLPSPIFRPPSAVTVPGMHRIISGVYVFTCPLCAREFRYDDPYEPMCTGPSWTDDHAPEVMRMIRREVRRVMV